MEIDISNKMYKASKEKTQKNGEYKIVHPKIKQRKKLQL